MQIIPLGGVGEVGKNCTLIRHGEASFLVDVGVMFPEEEILGVDAIIPDLSFVMSTVQELRGIVITHGHEDHIGAISYAVEQLPNDRRVPLYGSRLTLGLLRAKLTERNLMGRVDMHEVAAGETIRLADLPIEFLAVGHSIPDALALVLHTPAGVIIHTGDWKWAGTPPATRARLAELGEQGVHALLIDCVRIESAGRTLGEPDIAPTLEALMQRARGRVMITTFASHLERIGNIIQMAHRMGRTTALAGRSMERNIAVASELGYVNVPEGALVRFEETVRWAPEKVVLLMTGSQGEPNAALSRIATGDHRQIRVMPGDTVIFSSHPIPGNETNVSRVIDDLFRHGADVHYPAITPGLHVSGHAGREEHIEMLNLVRPRWIVPLHGEYRMMTLYRRMAAEQGFAPERVVFPEIGRIIDVTSTALTPRGMVASGAVLVDGHAVGLDSEVLLDRKMLAGDGVLVVSVTMDDRGRLLHEPEIVTRGLPAVFNARLNSGVRAKVAHFFHTTPSPYLNMHDLTERLSAAVGPLVQRETGLQPVILPIVRQLAAV